MPAAAAQASGYPSLLKCILLFAAALWEVGWDCSLRARDCYEVVFGASARHIIRRRKPGVVFYYPHIRLVYVPPNCTSQLQVANVILQRPFKHGLRKRFNEWADHRAESLSQDVVNQASHPSMVHRKLEQDERQTRLHKDGLAFLLCLAV